MRVSNCFASRLVWGDETFALLAANFTLTIKNSTCSGNEAAIRRIAASFRNCFGAHHILDYGGWMSCGEQAIDDPQRRHTGREARLVASEASG